MILKYRETVQLCLSICSSRLSMLVPPLTRWDMAHPSQVNSRSTGFLTLCYVVCGYSTSTAAWLKQGCSIAEWILQKVSCMRWTTDRKSLLQIKYTLNCPRHDSYFLLKNKVCLKSSRLGIPVPEDGYPLQCMYLVWTKLRRAFVFKSRWCKFYVS